MMARHPSRDQSVLASNAQVVHHEIGSQLFGQGEFNGAAKNRQV
jgi:hypothetical protein